MAEHTAPVRGERGGSAPRLWGRGAEYRVMRLLRRHGWRVLRAPASGARRREPVPDIVAMRNGRIVMFEVKLRNPMRTVYLDEIKYLGLKRYAEESGGDLYLAVVPGDVRDTRVVEWSKAELYETSRGRYYVFRKHVIEHSPTIYDVIDMYD